MNFSQEQIQQFIAEPDCDLQVPDSEPPCDYCSCNTDCRKQIKYVWERTNEREERFTEAERKEIDALYDPKMGFFREGIGCCLPREYRPINCLYCGCEYKMKQRGLL